MIVRVLQVVTIMNTGGIETLLMNIYRNIDRERIQFDFLVHRTEKGFYDDEIIQLGGNIYYVPPINPLKHKKYIKKLDSFFKDKASLYNIVHSHINTWSLYILRASEKAGIPIRISHSHVSSPKLSYKSFFQEYNKLFIKQYATHLFACSIAAGNYLFGEDCETLDNFYYFNNGVDLDKFAFNLETRKKIRKELLLDDSLIVIHVGNFSKPKNYPKLIEVFYNIVQLENKSKLLLVGNGPLRTKVKNIISKYGIEENVIFLGVRSDVYDLLQAADLFILPSLFEGLPLSVIEAQVSGILTIISDKVPKQALITKNAASICLKLSSKQWSKDILKMYLTSSRQTQSKEFIDAGYSINRNTKWLTDFYLREIDKL
ncbi:glycosyltransferase family 1 protein [Dysgonomonas sp. Marseille-Q5470]|uniref:glycosyltransferase family 1 protein n=1 Tax=Dysgonomonas sp. Marseille-Q5470 TaxID=3039494 RepID=UPI0024BD2C89|nr:glycosyltransferase family 1 protein [Dysgonomonas sp. Marseille-Q5470]